MTSLGNLKRLHVFRLFFLQNECVNSAHSVISGTVESRKECTDFKLWSPEFAASYMIPPVLYMVTGQSKIAFQRQGQKWQNIAMFALFVSMFWIIPTGHSSQISVSRSGSQTCAAKNGNLRCWGYGQNMISILNILAHS